MGEICSMCGQEVKHIGNLGSHVALKHTSAFLEFMKSMRPSGRLEERAEPIVKEKTGAYEDEGAVAFDPMKRIVRLR